MCCINTRDDYSCLHYLREHCQGNNSVKTKKEKKKNGKTFTKIS